MDVYGLTGGIGSGKSTVAGLLEEYGVPVVSADELSRVVVARGSEGLQAVVAQFGPEVVAEDGELDRARMASIVFRNAERRRELEAILHPRIRDRFEQVLDALEKAGHEVAVYEVPLLFERNLQGEMKAVILVTAPLDDRIARVRARDDVTETEVRARIAAQMDEDQKRRRADYIIENNGNLDELRREVEFLMARFLRIPTHRAMPSEDDRPTTSALITGSTMPPFAVPSGRAYDVPLESRRPTAVPTAAPASIAAPVDPTGAGSVESDLGPPTLVDSGPPTHARPDPVQPAAPAAASDPRSRDTDAVPAADRITRIDTGPPREG
ncbi:MAG: dephospho-CoA kinase [Myxococcales bacterium]|nr:dephospho-CoA kinase [Myxococcales bacterium]